MPLVDVREIVVHLDELTNLELLRKGLYRVAVRVTCGSVAAEPFACFAAPSRHTSHSRTIFCEGSDAASEAACIDEATGAYLTRSVYLRYIDETFDIGEGVHFRLELPHTLVRPAHRRPPGSSRSPVLGPTGSAAPPPSSMIHSDSFTDIRVTFTLLRADIEAVTPAASPDGRDEDAQSSMARKGPFTTASTRVLPLGPPSCTGRHVYVPVAFDTMNLCMLGATVHCALVSTRFVAPESPEAGLKSRVDTYMAAMAAYRRRGEGEMAVAAAPLDAGHAVARVEEPSGTPSPPSEEASRVEVSSALMRWATGAAVAALKQARPKTAASTSTGRWFFSSSGGEAVEVKPAREVAPSPPSLSLPDERSLRAAHTFAEYLFERWHGRRAQARVEFVTGAEAREAAAAASSEAAPPVAAAAFESLSPAEMNDVHARLLSRMGEAFVGLVEYRTACTRMEDRTAAAGQVKAHMPTTGDGAQLSGTRFSMPVRTVAARHATVSRTAPAIAARLRDAAALRDVMLSPCTQEYDARGGPVSEGRVTPASPRPARASDVSSTASSSSGVHVGGKDGFGMGGYDASGAVADTFPASFAGRARACAHDPEAVAHALNAEIDYVAAAIYDHWRRHVRLLTESRYDVHMPLQAIYRVAALRAAVDGVHDVWQTPDKLMDVADPWSSPAARSRRSSATSTLGAWGLAGHFPRACAPMLDVALSDARTAVEVRVYRYAHRARGSDTGSRAVASLSGADKHNFSDSEEEEDVSALASARSGASDESAPRIVRLHTASHDSTDAGSAAAEVHSVGAAAAVSSRLHNSSKLARSAVSVQQRDSMSDASDAIQRSWAHDAVDLSREMRGSRGGSDTDSLRGSFVSEGGPTPCSPVIRASSSDAAVVDATSHRVTLYEELRTAAIASVRPRMSPRKCHCVVFLNGLGGSTHDTRVIRSYLKLHYPTLFCAITTTNQGKATDDDLVAIATRVAKEIHEAITVEMVSEGLAIGKLSFVGFSLGGLVVRLALRHPLLQPYWPYLHAFVSVASPHLGLLYSRSSIVSAGIYIFQRWRKSESLAQLSFADEPMNGPDSIRHCLLYLLACGWQERLAALEKRMPPAAPVLFEPRAVTPRAHSSDTTQHDAVSNGRRQGGVHQIAEAGSLAKLLEGDAAYAHETDSPMQPTEEPYHVHHALPFDTTAASSSSVSMDVVGVDEAAAAAAVPVAGGIATDVALPRGLEALINGGFCGLPNGAIMRHFKHITLLSCSQDAYAPQWSCAVQMCDAALADARHGGAYGEMMHGFFDGMPLHAITRWDVRFKNMSSLLNGKLSMDSVIGREAHVAFLETDSLSALIALAMPHLWDADDALAGSPVMAAED